MLTPMSRSIRIAAAPLASLAAVLALASCSADVDPIVRCIDVTVEYGIAEDRADGADLCAFIEENRGLLGERSFTEVFGDESSARDWARAELAKD